VFLSRATSVGDCRLAVMSASQMRVEDRLAGTSNWSSWKARMIFVLEDLELWDIVEAVVPPIPHCSRLGGRIQEKEQQGEEDYFRCNPGSHYTPCDGEGSCI
jgi:hypothetical protein